MTDNPICTMNATDLSARIQRKELSVVEVMHAFLKRIEAVNPKVNAICALRPFEELLQAAGQTDHKIRAGEALGPLVGLPAISVPCGFTESGLPVGLQIVGRHHRDFDVLQLAYAFEQATRFSDIRPAID